MNKIFAQQAAALQSVGDRLGPDFDRAVDLILDRPGKVVVTGIGKSGIIAHKIAATLASTGSSAVFLNAGEALHGDLGMVAPDDVVLMLSKSANTTELAHMLPSIRRIGAALIGVFGAVNTALAEACDVVLDVSVDDEACPLSLAPTTSATVSMVMGDALAIALMQRRGFTSEDFAVLHPGGSLGRRLLVRAGDVIRQGGTPPAVGPDEPLGDAIAEMSRSARGAVCVVDSDRKILGILTEGDVRRLYLKSTELTVAVSTVMTPSPKVIPDSARLGEALDLMEAGERKVYVLPVVNAQNHYLGLLRMHDIVSM